MAPARRSRKDGPRLCAKHQPQRMETGWEIGVIEAGYRCNVLRLDPSDTAAVRLVGDSLESCYECALLEDSTDWDLLESALPQ